MKGFIQAKIKRVKSAASDWRQQRIWRDKLSVGLIVTSLSFNLLTLVILLFTLKPTDQPVPVHYSSLVGGFDRLGPWYQIYLIALFGLGVTVVNTFLASVSFTRSRITSFFLLTGGFAVALFCLIISTAFSLISS